MVKQLVVCINKTVTASLSRFLIANCKCENLELLLIAYSAYLHNMKPKMKQILLDRIFFFFKKISKMFPII